MRYYKINNQYYPYNQIHTSYGYTKVPTDLVGYLTVSPWAGPSLATGYKVITNVYSESNYFIIDNTGWNTLNDLTINNGYFPDNVEYTSLSRNGELSEVVSLSFEDEPRYLIEKDLSAGWVTEEEYQERGWMDSNIIISGIVTPTTDRKEKIQNLPELENYPTYINLSSGFIPDTVKITPDFNSLGLVPEYIPDGGVIQEYYKPYDRGFVLINSTGRDTQECTLPELEFISPDIHIPAINKTVTELPYPPDLIFITKNVHIPSLSDKTFIDLPVPQIEFINKYDVVPVVSYTQYYLSSDQSSATVTQNTTKLLYDSLGNTIPYNEEENYNMVSPQWDGTFEIVNSNGNLAMKRTGGSNIVGITTIKLSTCTPHVAKNKFVYSIFKQKVNAYTYWNYTANQREYWILDGSNNQWVNDPESLGYSLTQRDYTILYMDMKDYNSVQEQASVRTISDLDTSYTYPLYTDDGIQDSSTKFTPDPEIDYIPLNLVGNRVVPLDETQYRSRVLDMPSTTTSMEEEAIHLVELLSTGDLWLGSNYTSVIQYTGLPLRFYREEVKDSILHTAQIDINQLSLTGELVFTVTLTDFDYETYTGYLYVFVYGFVYQDVNNTTARIAVTGNNGILGYFDNGVCEIKQTWRQPFEGSFVNYSKVQEPNIAWLDPTDENIDVLIRNNVILYSHVSHLPIPYNPNKTYQFLALFNANGENVGNSRLMITSVGSSGKTYLGLTIIGGSSSLTGCKVYYRMS